MKPLRASGLLFLSLSALSLVACGGSTRARILSAHASTPTTETPDDGLEEACVPTGPERCFDARDDNCNGVIDEGCGVPTGMIQFEIAWDPPTADVDLLVTDPKGSLAEVGRPSLAGLIKDRDCPGKKQECQGQNYENVYLDGEDPKPGTYRVKVRLERISDDGDDEGAVRVTLGARVGSRTRSMNLSLSKPGQTKECVFVL